MPAPGSATYSTAAKVAAQTSFRDLIDSGTGAGTIKLRDSSDVLLGTITLDDPCGTVDGAGQLTITATSNGAGSAAGTCAYADVCDSDGDVHLALPAEAGTSPVSGKIVLSTLTIADGSPLPLVSFTVG